MALLVFFTYPYGLPQKAEVSLPASSMLRADLIREGFFTITCTEEIVGGRMAWSEKFSCQTAWCID